MSDLFLRGSDFIGIDVEEAEEEIIRYSHPWSENIVRISRTDEDVYFFYRLNGADAENACIELYFDSNGIIYDANVCTY